MQTSVNLQDPFSYSLYPIIILLVILLIYTIIIFHKPKKNKKIKALPKERPIDVKKIKSKYIKKLDEVEYKLENNKISTRIAYQHTSSIIRNFVHEVTRIKVQNYTLMEIKNLKMPILYELVQEYYVPEFAERSFGDIQKSIEKTRKVIEKWS